METGTEGGPELYELVMRDFGAAPPAPARSGGVTARDLLVLLAVAAKGRSSWRAADLARELGLSFLDVSLGLERARRVGLMDDEKTRVLKAPMLEFLVHALRYVFPAELGASSRGLPTAQLAGRFVWPSRDGGASGRALSPLDAAAARAGGGLRELLGLVDVLRVGLVWERTLAVREISRRLDASS
jgi:hypothetical protein